jgi:hypothetical protein
MANNVLQTLAKTAFGELSVAENTPVIQLSCQYGQLGQTTSINVAGGTSGCVDSKFFAQAPAAANSLGSLISERALTYRPGEGAKGRFTFKFDTPAAGNEQDAGLLGFNDTLTFGYNGLDFGIWYRRFAQQEVQLLTITTPAIGSENATVTIDGTGYTIPLTSGTVGHNAYEIATSLNDQVQLWDFDSTDNTVTAVQNLVSATVGAFAFSSATAAAAWVQTKTAEEWTISFIEQADWNGNYSFTITPDKLTPAEVSFEYLGGGGIDFKVENPDTSDFEIVHTIKAAGTSDLPTLKNPTFRVGVASENTTNTTAIRVESASLGAFIEGKKINTSGSKGKANATAAVGTTPTNILTLRCRNEFGGIRNLAEVILAVVGASTDAVKTVSVQIIKNAIPATSFTYTNVSTSDSVMQTAVDAVTVSGGEVIAAGEPGQLDLSSLNQVLIPGESITIAMNVASGASADMQASSIWFEDQ